MFYFFYLGGLVFYFVLHSWLASSKMKDLLKRWISARTYRLSYNVISILTLLPIIWLYIRKAPPPFSSNLLVTMIGMVFIIFSLFLFRKCIPLYEWSSFLGLQDEIEPKLVNVGFLREVRHPLYLASIVMLFGACLIHLNLWSLSTLVVVIVYLLFGIQFEEKKLIDQFGNNYRQYQKQVPMLFPKLKRNKL